MVPVDSGTSRTMVPSAFCPGLSGTDGKSRASPKHAAALSVCTPRTGAPWASRNWKSAGWNTGIAPSAGASPAVTRRPTPTRWPFWVGSLPGAVQVASATRLSTVIENAVAPVGSSTLNVSPTASSTSAGGVVGDGVVGGAVVGGVVVDGGVVGGGVVVDGGVVGGGVVVDGGVVGG